MGNQTHPIDEMYNQINKLGLMLIDGVNQMFNYEKPSVSPFIVLGLNHHGWTKANYDMRLVEFNPHDLVIIPPGHILMSIESSDDYSASFIFISPQFLEQLINQHTFFHGLMEFTYNLAFHLTDEQYDGIYGFFWMLHLISKMNYPERDTLLANQLEIGSKLIEIYLHENGISHDFTSTQQIVNRFKNAITKHCTENRTVQYYANLLCLSPKYFGSIIKEQTGIAASDWISRYVIIKAQSLLRFRKDLNIQQISRELGFADATSFTRYFKTNAGMSPKEYRNKAEETGHPLS